MRTILALVAITLCGCAANTLRPEAQKVRLLGTTPGSECKYIGDATGGQGNFFTGQYTSNANLQAGAINDLKNQAAAMGDDWPDLPLLVRAGLACAPPHARCWRRPGFRSSR